MDTERQMQTERDREHDDDRDREREERPQGRQKDLTPHLLNIICTSITMTIFIEHLLHASTCYTLLCE